MTETRKLEVLKITAYVVDYDGLGEEGYKDLLENTNYPNHTPEPIVDKIESVEIDYSDEHPVNNVKNGLNACKELFEINQIFGIEKCKKCKFGYVGSHFSCLKENDGKCSRYKNIAFEPED